MSKKFSPVVEKEEPVQTFDTKAFTLVKRDDKFEVVEIEFDSENLVAGVAKVIRSEKNQFEAEEQLRVAIGKALIR